MSHRISLITLLGVSLAITVACTNKKSVNPLANIGSKQPDKVLFDKAMEAMKHNRFDVARMTLQTLINTYPDSEFIARAKLAEGDSWYAEGGTASLAQAEQVYRDFETFFPNMPEAAEAQLKIANIQYQQMEKSDRDYTHAKRAEDEYRNLIMQYPDNAKLVKEGKELSLIHIYGAWREALFGNLEEAKREADAGLALAPDSRDAQQLAALVLARTGDAVKARALAQELAKRYPLHTIVQSYWLPAIQAQLALNAKDAGGAIAQLRNAAGLEYGLTVSNANNSCLYSVYLRGEAYLAAGQEGAAAEFQKIIDHPGVVWNLSLIHI